MADVDWNWILRQLPYQGRKDQLANTYQGQLAQTTYNRSMLATNEGLALADLGQSWHESRQQIPGAYGRRGLLNSGIYKKGLGEFAQERQKAFDRTKLGYAQQRGQFDVTDQTNLSNYNQGVTGVEYDRVAADVAYKQDLANQLRGIL
jgi:hypothetical protein